uniref:hypothetical protein n=1 Tax=Crenothrix polyspora TaxID=360316 RepID=UPI001177B350
MKLIPNMVVVVFSFCWTTASYAVNGALVFDKSYTNSREPAYMTPSGTCPKPSLGTDTYWGTDVINGDYGRKLVKYALDGTATAYTESNIDNLTPKGRTDKPFLFNSIDHVWPLPDGSVLFAAEAADYNNYLYKFKNGNVGNNPVVNGSTPAYGNKQAVLNMGERQVNGVVNSVPNIRALHHRSIVVATIDCQTVLFYGEYNVSNDKRLALWKSTDMGDTWSIAFEWNVLAEQTFHIHGVVQNPYNGWIYILFGDYDSESAIVAWDGVSLSPTQQADNPSPAQMKNYLGWKSIAGSQRVRTGDLIFTPPTPAGTGKAVWIPDIDVLQAIDDFTGGDISKSKGVLYSQQANYDLTGLQATGAVPNYTNGFPPILGTRSERSGNIYWSSFRIANNVPPLPSKEIYLWRSADSGLTWTQDVKPPMYLDGVDDYTALPKDLYVNT